jgi:AcrR family transcriptional regulator
MRVWAVALDRDSDVARSNQVLHVHFSKRSACVTVAAVPTRSPVRTPSARPRISREFLDAHRRRRYVEATAEILHEFGRRGATTTNVVSLAGGSRNSFYEVFGSVEDCIAYGIALADAELFEGLDRLGGEDDWLAEVHSAVTAFYEAVASRPLLGSLFLIHSAASRTDVGREASEAGGERFAALIARGSAAAEGLARPRPPEFLAEGLSRSIVALAAARVRGPQVDSLPGEAGSMTALVGGFYLGPEGTAQVLRALES